MAFLANVYGIASVWNRVNYCLLCDVSKHDTLHSQCGKGRTLNMRNLEVMFYKDLTIRYLELLHRSDEPINVHAGRFLSADTSSPVSWIMQRPRPRNNRHR